MKQLLSFFLAPLFLICPSKPPETVTPDYLITGIIISCPEESPVQRIYSDQRSMELILQYLRKAEIYGKTDIDSIDKNLPLYTVTLTHITGRQTVYRQLGDAFLCKGNSPWYQLDPTQGRILPDLYRSA